VVGWCSDGLQRWEAAEQDGFRHHVGGLVVIWVQELPVEILELAIRQIWMKEYFVCFWKYWRVWLKNCEISERLEMGEEP
jgi:hypothetical protein